MITMGDIAERAGVSRATVSYVLNGRDTALRISEETRQRVLQTAEEHGYRRNALLDAVRSRRNTMLGFLVHRPEAEAVARMIAGALDEADDHGYTVKVLRLHDRDIDRRTIEKCLELRLAGVMVLYLGDEMLSELHETLSRFGMPVVALDTETHAPVEARIATNDRQAMKLAVSHLQQLGHKRIGLFAFPPEEMAQTSLQERVPAFIEGIREAGLNPQDCGIYTNKTTAENYLGRALVGGEHTSALIGVTDALAMDALRMVREAGLHVPRDVSVVGYGGLELTTNSDPPLTTVVQPFQEIGRESVRRLMCNISASAEGRTAARGRKGRTLSPAEALLPAELIVRQSTDAPPNQ